MPVEQPLVGEWSHPRRALLTERSGGGQIGEYLVNDPDLNNIAKGIGLLLCPSKAERSLPSRPSMTTSAFARAVSTRFRPANTLCAHARETYRRSGTQPCDGYRCIDPFLRACADEPCFYTVTRDVTWPRTAFLIGENKVVTARHSLPIGLDLNVLNNVRVIFGLTRDRLRELFEDPNAQVDIDDQELLTVARYKPGTYNPGPSDRYDWATFEIEVMTPGRGPLKPAKALVKNWISKRANGRTKYELAMLGHPLGLPMTLVRNETMLTRVYPPGTRKNTALPKGMLLASMDSIDGYSGAPVLTQIDDKWQIVGLCVGTAHNGLAADPNVRACALSAGAVVGRGGKGIARILPAEFFFFKEKASPVTKKKKKKKKNT